MASAGRTRGLTSDARKVPRQRLPRSRVVRRPDYIVSGCRGKAVLHVGCADAPFTREKLAAGTWLHGDLDAVASRCVGIDIDADAVAWLATRGFEDIHVADAATVADLVHRLGFTPEVVVAGEVLEHLAQPADFLTGLRRAVGHGASLILSVPNAFNAEGILQMVLGVEKVHEEHVAYYSYRTISRLLEATGFEVVEILPYRETGRGAAARLTGAILGALLWLRPHFAPGYVVRARAVATDR